MVNALSEFVALATGTLLLERPSVSRAGAVVEAAEEVRRKGLVGGRSPATSGPRSGVAEAEGSGSGDEVEHAQVAVGSLVTEGSADGTGAEGAAGVVRSGGPIAAALPQLGAGALWGLSSGTVTGADSRDRLFHGVLDLDGSPVGEP